MENYDNYGDKKPNYFFRVSLIMLIVGVLLLIAGFAWHANADMSNYYKTTEVNETYDAANVSGIEIDYSSCVVKLAKSNDDKIHITGKVPDDVKISCDEKLLIKQKMKIWSFFSLRFWDDDKQDTSLEILLPEKEYGNIYIDGGEGESELRDIQCDSVQIDVGAGEIYFDNVKVKHTIDIDGGAGEVDIANVSCEKLMVDMGAGEMKVKDSELSGKMTVDGGAGEIEVINTSTGGLDIDCGVGEFTYSGRVEGDIKVDGGVGECTLDLENPSSDFGKGKKYSLDIDTGVGDVTVNYDQNPDGEGGRGGKSA